MLLAECWVCLGEQVGRLSCECGGRRRHDSVCNRGAVRCSWIEVGYLLLVLGGCSDSREVWWMSWNWWPSQCSRCVLCVGGMMGPVMFPWLCFGCGIEGPGAVFLPRYEWRGQLVGTGRRGWSSV
jgi:hypothetical protein